MFNLLRKQRYSVTFKQPFLIVLVLIDNWLLNVIFKKIDSLKKGALWWDAGANADFTAPARVDIISPCCLPLSPVLLTTKV